MTPASQDAHDQQVQRQGIAEDKHACIPAHPPSLLEMDCIPTCFDYVQQHRAKGLQRLTHSMSVHGTMCYSNALSNKLASGKAALL